MGLIHAIAHHGYAAVAAVLFFAAAGVPLPASLSLLTAGAAAAHHSLSLFKLLPIAVGSAVAGDIVLYLGGRFTGWWLLGKLCRVSMDPETCIFTSADFFYRKGARTLMFAKFLPGLGTMAAPLAGSLHMRFWRFLMLDVVGAIFYTTAWILGGYFLSPFLLAIERFLAVLGHVTAAVVLGAILVYGGMWALAAIRNRKYRLVERISADELRERLEDKDHNRLMIIADVRSHGYYDPGMMRIKNSIRVEPSRLPFEIEALEEFMQPECEIYVYCSCVRDATSARVAHALMERGTKVRIIEGGLKAWERAGCPLEPVPAGDVAHLPRFD